MWVCSWVSVGLFMGFRRLGRIWLVFGGLDLGLLVVIFPMGWGFCFNGFDGGFQCLFGSGF